MFEIFEHTADIGLRVRAGSLADLYAEAARGLAALLIDRPDELNPTLTREFQILGTDRADLLVDWLNELLYQFETAHLIFVQFAVQMRENELRVEARGGPPDPARHPPNFGIKAITYHHLKVEPADEGWLAEVILDI